MNAPEGDLSLVKVVADMAFHAYVTDGKFSPIGVLETDSGLFRAPTIDITSNADKHLFMNVMRYLSVKLEAVRSAVAFEAWDVVTSDGEAKRLFEEIVARGGSVQDHPDAVEAIYVIVESDTGTLIRNHRIVREGATTTLEAHNEEFLELGGTRSFGGTFSNFHIWSSERESEAIQKFMNIAESIISVDMDAYEPTEIPGPSSRPN